MVEVDGASCGRSWQHRLEGRFYQTLQSLLVQHIAVMTVIHKLKDVPFFGYPITQSLLLMVSPKSLCKEMQVGFWWRKLKTNLGEGLHIG